MSTLVAALGPTNTGKTHRAIERMLDFESGMIGLPLRLLAREVYDKVCQRVGRDRVALITGEEKRIGKDTQYWICTVEAMPQSRSVAFVAVDEIQLAAHEQRGHVFTDRMLHLRGTHETWLLGSDTMAPLVAQLVPDATITTHPRLSRLSHAGAVPLSRLPPRSAVVAFSMAEVYTIAEKLRVQKGGAAVVLGALSPRTRNAQVAMFQAGEVDYLVATDAIGMGLNLDVQHVAFAALDKFDGKRLRQLEPAEIGQIAGRAGRFLQSGTFGTIAPLALPSWASKQVEEQRFQPVERLRWRKHALDFSSVAALIASLREGPRSNPELSTAGRSQRRRGLAPSGACPALLPMNDAEDFAALQALAARVEASDVALLWQVCGIPDFRKLLFEAHLDDLIAVHTALKAGPIDDAWMEHRVRPLENVSGDVDDLTARIAGLRTWAYVSNQAEWLHDPRLWQERTRAAEDALSDALHDALVLRFVKTKKKRASNAAFKGLENLIAATTEKAPALDWDALADADHERFAISAGRVISAELGEERVALADLLPGKIATQPALRLRDLPIRPSQRQQIERRLTAFLRDSISRFMAPVLALAKADSPAVRALGFALERGLGTVHALPRLTERDRDILQRLGVVVHAEGAYVKAMQKQQALRRALLSK